MRDDKTWPRATHYFIKRRHWSLFIRRWVLWEWVSFVVHICSNLRLTLHFSDCVLVLFCRRPCCICKHCQRHNGPEGWVHITRSQYTVHRHIEHITISESRLSINFKISTKHRLNLKLRSWPNLASEYWPRFNFVTSTKHQQQNTDQTSASKSRRTSTSKSWQKCSKS